MTNTSLVPESVAELKARKEKEEKQLEKKVKAKIKKLSSLPIEVLKKQLTLDFLEVYMMLGGPQGMFKYADQSNANRTEFYKMLNSTFRAVSGVAGGAGDNSMPMPSITIIMADGKKSELKFNIGNQPVVEAEVVEENS